MSKPLSYVEEIAVDLGRVVGAQPGSLMWHGIVGALKEVVERCAAEADRKPEWDERGRKKLAARIRALTEERG